MKTIFFVKCIAFLFSLCIFSQAIFAQDIAQPGSDPLDPAIKIKSSDKLVLQDYRGYLKNETDIETEIYHTVNYAIVTNLNPPPERFSTANIYTAYYANDKKEADRKNSEKEKDAILANPSQFKF